MSLITHSVHGCVEDRLISARQAMALIIAASRTDFDTANVDQEDVFAAIEGLADDVRRLLKPLKDAPAELLNWCPEKTDDQQSD